MSGFGSSFKKNSHQEEQRSYREFNVGPPEELYEEQQFTSVEEAKQVAREVKTHRQQVANKISDHAKKRIEILSDIGRLTKDVNADGVVFSLRTLKAKEMKQAMLASYESAKTDLEASYENRKQQLARSIFKIDGEDIDIVIGSSSLNDKLQFVEENLEESLISLLWDEYVALKQSAKNKYGVNSEKDVSEVSEDLKKS